jgi:hypothetical protein
LLSHWIHGSSPSSSPQDYTKHRESPNHNQSTNKSKQKQRQKDENHDNDLYNNNDYDEHDSNDQHWLGDDQGNIKLITFFIVLSIVSFILIGIFIFIFFSVYLEQLELRRQLLEYKVYVSEQHEQLHSHLANHNNHFTQNELPHTTYSTL